MIHCKEVQEYISLVEKGQVVLSVENHKLIKNIVKPLLLDKNILFNQALYYEFIRYAEKYYQPLFPYQKFLAFFHFLTYKNDDTLVFSEYFYFMGRGNGKDGFVAPLINFFQTQQFGIKNYDIDIIANSEAQAKGTFRVIYDNIVSGKLIVGNKTHFKATGDNIIGLKTNSILTYNTSNGKTKDGKRPGCVVFNELHAYEDYTNVSVHVSGMGKVKHGRIINITTDGNIRGGPLDDLLAVSRQKLDGEHETLRLFPFICKLDNEEEHTDFVAMEKANPSINYLPNLKQTIEGELTKIKLNPSLYIEFITKRMNIPKIAPEQCVTEWENIEACNRDIPNLEGLNCICGIDTSGVRDFTSAVLLFKLDDELVVLQHSWVCKQSPTLNLVKFDLLAGEHRGELTLCDGSVIDETLVCNWISEQMEKYNIISIATDLYRYGELKGVLDDMGFTPKNKANPHGNLVLVRNGTYTHNLNAPLIEKYFITHKIIWGNCRIMNWYTNNTKVVTDSKGNKRYEKIAPLSRKNDGFMAFLHAFSQLDSLENKGDDFILDVIL